MRENQESRKLISRDDATPATRSKEAKKISSTDDPLDFAQGQQGLPMAENEKDS